MLTYHQVMTTDLTPLTTAADKWDAMAEELKKVAGRYGDSVQKITMGPDWLGASVLVAHDSFTGTRYEYSAAQVQAKAIASLLRDAHEQLTDLRNRVENAREEAVKAGMTVSEAGRVSFDFSRLTPAERSVYHHDPDGEASIRKAVTEWQQRIDDGVKAVSEADQGVKIALDAVVVDSNKDAFGGDQTSHGFNADTQGDIEVYAKSQEFSQTFLNGMGAENTLKLANKLNDHAYGDDKGNKQRYLDVEKGLANSLSNAMRDSKSAFYQDFRTQLKQTGAQRFDLKQIGDSPQIGTGHGQKVRGYQSPVTLMRNGDGYSAPFMRDLADDIRTAEDKKRGGNPDVWDLTSDFSGRNKGWFANDPLDGLLGIMSKDPAAAASYLDPGPDGKNDNLPYLLKDRDWNQVDTTTWTGNIERTGSDTFDKDVRAGLGLDLEATTTGHPAASPGTELGHDARADGDHSQIQNSRSSLLRVLRGASEDPENYFLLHESERRYMAQQITTEHLSDPEALKNRAAKIGEVNGAINAIGGDVSLSKRDAELSAATDQRVHGYHVIGGAVTGVPVVGDLAQRVVDGCWNEWLKAVTAEEGLLARERISSGNDAAQQDLNQFFTSWGRESHQSDMVGAAQREARQSYTSGRESAYDALRDRK
ncbi:hypothetical protein ACFW7J_08775 [Streptomyces sp. NPDC059525]|uniref:hypothetical protein n=1 Tax=Streptomyces sp. NPDC059525 TaxID=3346857 RepID=UPI0036C62596